MQQRQSQMWSPSPPGSSSRPPGVQAGMMASGPMGSMFSQNGIGPVQVAMITDAGVPETARVNLEFVRQPCALSEQEFTLHGAVALCPEKLAPLTEQAMHSQLTVHLGNMVEDLVGQRVIAPNTQIVGIRVAVTNDSPIPVGCIMELNRMDYDPMAQDSLRDRNFMDSSHRAKGFSALSAVIPSRKTVSFEPLAPRGCTDAYPSRAGAYGLRPVLRATKIGETHYQVQRASVVSKYITETVLAMVMKQLKYEEVPPSTDTKFWSSIEEWYNKTVTRVHQGTSIQVPEPLFAQYATEILRARSQMLLAADCYRDHPWEVRQRSSGSMQPGLSISFRPTDLISDPPVVTQDSAASTIFSKSNPWIVAASGGGSDQAVRAVLGNTYMITFAVIIKFAVQPPDVLARDLKNLPTPTMALSTK